MIEREIRLQADQVELIGDLCIPADAPGIVVFAHGSGSSRHSPRNRFVSEVLVAAGLGTLLFDLLTVAEERRRSNVFDIPLLAERLLYATQSLRQTHSVDVPTGYFGASTGAAAALAAAAQPEARIDAVVSRGGRPDLAGPWLPAVSAPTLLIVGSRDTAVLEMNREALAMIECHAELEIVPGASHLFEESGTLRQAAELARDWFVRFLATPPNVGG